MNQTNGQASAEKGTLPGGYVPGTEVPDSLIPVTRVDCGSDSSWLNLQRANFVKGPIAVNWLSVI